MATYYVRKTGSDAAAGTSAGAAWLTIGKALGAAGIASGDTVYIGAGVYRGFITVAMTSATVETKIIGDVDGVQTGDAGEIVITCYTVNDYTLPAATQLLIMAGRDYLTFENISFITAVGYGIDMSTQTSQNITFRRCRFQNGSLAMFYIQTAANVTSGFLMDSCISLVGLSNFMLIYFNRPATADFNVGFTIKNSIFIGGGSTPLGFNSLGANAFKHGGVDILNNTYIGAGQFLTCDTNFSTTYPINVYNNLIYGSNSVLMQAAVTGQIIEDYNLALAGSRTNITAGAHSVIDKSFALLFNTGHEYSGVGSNLTPFGSPKTGSPSLSHGSHASTPSTDMLGVTRPAGMSLCRLGTGTATAGGAKTLTDSGKTWGTNELASCTIKIVTGTGSGQTKSIASNTATVITVDGNWKTQPSTDSVYIIYDRARSSSGTATAGSTTTLTDGNAAWGTNSWQGYTLEIDGGTGSPQSLIVVSNTATVLTFATATAPDGTSTYKLYRGASENVINKGVGAYELGNTGVKETTTVRTGSNALRIPGAGYQDFVVPVDASSTTVSVYARYDSQYSGTLPQMKILNGTECGVTDATATAVGSADTWEQLSLNFTPTAKGIVTIRIISNSTTPTGNAFFDDFNVT